MSGVGDPFDQYKAGHQCTMVSAAEGDGNGRGDTGSWPTLPSLDQHCAAKAGGQTPLPSLALSASSDPGHPTGRSVLSWKGPNQPITPYNRPAQVFDLLFGAGAGGAAAPSGQEPARLVARRQSVLDAVKADAARLRARLGGTDRQRVEAYEQSVRELERSLAAAPPAPSCGAVDRKPFDAAARPSGQAGALEDLLLKLVVLAFRCDRTRYGTYMLEHALGEKRFSNLGSNEADHVLSHSGRTAEIVARTNVKLSYLAGLLRDMAAVPEGAGTLLDNVIVYSNSDCYDGNGHTRRDHQCIIVGGRAGGRLRGGRHLRYDRKPLNDLFASLLNHAGIPTEKWGRLGTGTLAGL